MQSGRTSAYIGVVIATGAVILGAGLWDWHTQDWTRFLFYCAMALIASGMKVTLPTVNGAMSMNFLFVLVGIAELSRSETMVTGCLGMVLQCVFLTKTRPKPVQVLFNVATIACAIEAAYAAYHLPVLATHTLEAPAMLLLAAGTYFVVNTFLIAIVIALTEDKSVWSVWRNSYFWTFPNYLVSAAVAWGISESSRRFGWQATCLLLPVLYVIYRSHNLYLKRLEEEKKRADDQRRHAEEVAALHRRTIKTLALAIEAKDQTTGDHLARVEVYAVEVGRELGLSAEELEALRASALLHDIGKLAIPESIISKPGKLTPEEFEKMKTHTIIGAEIVEQVRFPYAVAPIVRAHHEKWDGSGYPDGLAREQIPMGARILSAVDCLDALASDRQYRRALPLDEAIKVVQGEAGKAYDPRVVEVLVRRCVELEIMASRVAQMEKARLSIDVRIERGAAPAAGFEVVQADRTKSDLSRFQEAIQASSRAPEGREDLIRDLESCPNREEAYRALSRGLPGIAPYDAMAIYERRGEHLALEYLDGDAYRMFASVAIPLGMGLSGWVAENGKAIINGNPSVEPGYLADPKKFSVLRSALSVPIHGPDGVRGVASLYRQERDAFSPEQLSLLQTIADKLGRLTSAVEAAPYQAF